jgi:hypothetical protein
LFPVLASHETMEWPCVPVRRSPKGFEMKFVSVTTVLLLIAAVAWGPGAKKPSKPRVAPALYYLDSSGQLVPLESAVIQIEHQNRGLGLHGGTTVYLTEREVSPVRLKAEPKPEFIARLGDNLDPSEYVRFYRFHGEHGSRVLPLGTYNGHGRAVSVTLEDYVVDFNAAKEGTSFKLVPTGALAPGEYCLMITTPNPSPTKNPGFCFGVDAAGGNAAQ